MFKSEDYSKINYNFAPNFNIFKEETLFLFHFYFI